MRFVVISDLHLRIPGDECIKLFWNIEDIYNKKLMYYSYKYRHFSNGNEMAKDAADLYLRKPRNTFVNLEQNFLNGLADEIIRLNPDFLFITGDIFQSIRFNTTIKQNIPHSLAFHNIIKRKLPEEVVPNSYKMINLFKSFLSKLTYNKIMIFILTGNHDLERINFWWNFSDMPFVHIAVSGIDNIAIYHYFYKNVVFAFWLMPYIPATNSYDRCLIVKNLLSNIKFYFDNKRCYNFLFGHQAVDLKSEIDLTNPNLYRNGDSFGDNWLAPINANLCSAFEAAFFGHQHKVKSTDNVYLVDNNFKMDKNMDFSIGAIRYCDCYVEHGELKKDIQLIKF